MSGALHAPEDFAIVRCRECERDVLTYPDPRPDEPALRRCAHCDERASGELRWVGVADLAALGYVLDSGEDPEKGCTSCGSGGCGTRRES